MLEALRVRATDGRQVAVQVSGSPSGHPVFLMHGTPGSRVAPLPRPMILHGLGVRLITFDRPGYGYSDRLKSRQVADVVPDVEAIADALDVEQFAVLGRSGGGPHALACAALIPNRVTRAGALVSLAPWAADGLDWFAGMADSNVQEFTTALNSPDELAASLAQTAAAVKGDPGSHVSTLGPELPAADQRVVADAGIRALLARNFKEALRESADGWFDDNRAFCSPWGFDPADIKVPVLVWHGEDDVFSPVGHTQWLAKQIPNASLLIQPGAAHFSALEVLPDMLSWLIRSVE
jgi:pimeloyl-ACP methyl ester carboxylesterase